MAYYSKPNVYVKTEFKHESSQSSGLFPSYPSDTSVQWELKYKQDEKFKKCKRLNLCLVSGALKAYVHFSCEVRYMNTKGKRDLHFSSGNRIINKGEYEYLLQVEFGPPEHGNCKTSLELCMLDITPVVEIPCASTLTASLSATLETESSLNDVTLYFGPEKESFRASKFMLMTRSPVFNTMFQSGLSEAKANEVIIPDVTPAVGKEMITYIYTDEVPNIQTMAEELWFVAEKYQLSGLKALCENGLVKKLNWKNAAHFLLFAGRYCGDGRFKDYVLSFITQDKDTCSQVMRSNEWKEVRQFPDLALAVSDKFFDVPTEPATKKVKIGTSLFG